MNDDDHGADHLFVVRLRAEQDEGRTRWRGSVEHVPSGRRLFFADLTNLTDFIALRAAHRPPTPPDP